MEETITARVIPWSDVLISLLLAVLAGGIWVYEIFIEIGAEDYGWLNVTHWTPYVVVGLSVIAYLIPLSRQQPRFDAGAFFLAGIELYLIALIAYHIARIVLFSLYMGFYGYLSEPMLWGVLLLVSLMTAVSFANISRRRLRVDVPHQWGWVMAAIVLSLPLAWLSTWLWPGAEQDHSLLTTVKMGLPHGWLTFLLGMAATCSPRKAPEGFYLGEEDVLDDISFK